jgi:hypothetical protein
MNTNLPIQCDINDRPAPSTAQPPFGKPSLRELLQYPGSSHIFSFVSVIEDRKRKLTRTLLRAFCSNVSSSWHLPSRIAVCTCEIEGRQATAKSVGKLVTKGGEVENRNPNPNPDQWANEAADEKAQHLHAR